VDLLTTKEVARLLRTKERKIYELVSRNAIPVSRATGKLLFPRALVEAWVRKHVESAEGVEALETRPGVLAGSSDPLLDWALKESGSGLATLCDGSLDGLERLVAGKAVAAAIHIFDSESGTWNLEAMRRDAPGLPIVLIGWAKRRQGMILPPGNPARVEAIEDLRGKRVVQRQDKAGSWLLFRHLLREAGMTTLDLELLERPARSEADVALAVAEGRADAGLAIESQARLYRLEFLPLAWERFDIAVWRRDYFEPPLQRLFAFAASAPFRARAEALGGYDLGEAGQVRYNGG
jgi:excisionase family DNA binding protein